MQILALLFLLIPFFGATAAEDNPMHWSAKKTIWDRKTNQVELHGNATVNRKGESLVADFIKMDMDKRMLYAKGNCIYVASETLVMSDELEFNLDSGSGVIQNGRITNGGFLIVGERINRLNQTQFQAHDAEYTTCHDCPGSWSFHSHDLDLELEGYAHLKNVTGKIKDAPIAWSPYLVLPVKSQRQTGFLFPKYGTSSLHGFTFVQPFFWATGRSTDMTIGLGNYSDRGPRIEWEGRYAVAQGSAEADFFYLGDNLTRNPKPDRYAYTLIQDQRFPLEIKQRLKIFEVSDNVYPVQFIDDVPGREEPVLSSKGSAEKSTQNYTLFVEGRRYRNLINEDSDVIFDKKTVQLLPQAQFTLHDRALVNTPVQVGMNLGYSNFTRQDPAFDYDLGRGTGDGDFIPGTDPIREASRFQVEPKAYTSFRIADRFMLQPRARFKHYYYDFGGNLPTLNRGYLHLDTELSTQIERVYDYDDPDIPKLKHLIRPKMIYSRIPYFYDGASTKTGETHSFIRQVENRGGYNFDSNDIVPIGTSSLVNYFVPQGHSVTYGFVTQLVRRRSPTKDLFARYQRSIEFETTQTYNILEARKSSEDQVPFSRIASRFEMIFDQFGSSTIYNYYPSLSKLIPDVPESDRSPHEVSTGFFYTIEKTLHQKVLEFERSFGMGYTFSKLLSRTSNLRADISYSINDYILPKASASYDLNERKFNKIGGTLIIQNPSRCWRIVFNASKSSDRLFELTNKVDINLVGSGFGGVSDLAN